MTRVVSLGLLLLGAVAGGAAHGAVTAAPGWAVRAIPAPGMVQGGVVQRDGVAIVGVGSFGAGQQSVVRLSDEPVTIATGFNALGGFALAPDGTLFVVDNGGDLTGAATGDTVYAIPDALSRTDAVAAADAAVLPAGTLPFAQDVERLPDGRLLVSESTGPGAGRVAVVDGTTATTVAGGLDYASGLALVGATVHVANADASFVGAVRRFDLGGNEAAPLVSSLSGAFALAVDASGDVLVSGGFADDFSSTVVAVDAAGAVTERARGFGFSTELFYDPVADETLVLDAGASEVTVLCRDRDLDGTCDAGCGSGASLRARIDARPVSPPLPAASTLTVRATLGFDESLPRAEPRQSGLALRVARFDGVMVDLVLPPGNDWRRAPTGGWVFAGEGLPRAKVRIGKDGATVRVRLPGTVYGAEGVSTRVQLGMLCAAAESRCQLRGRRRQRLRCR